MILLSNLPLPSQRAFVGYGPLGTVKTASKLHEILPRGPRRWGAAMRRLRPWPDLRPGVETFFLGFTRPLRTS